MKRWIASCATAVVVAGCATVSAPPALADGPAYTFTVNSAADTHDQAPGDGNCYDNLLRCTLRAAMEEANAQQADTDDKLLIEVDFAIPGTGPHVIKPTSPLPVSRSSIQLRATTQPGYSPGHPMIEVDGSLKQSLAGFYILGDGSAVQGFDIHDFWVGVYLSTESGGIGFDTVSGNFIGTDVTGQDGMGNDVGVYDDAPNSTVGGDTRAERNVISGNGDGVQVTTNGSGAWIIGNYIGTNAAGTASLAPLTPDGTVNDLGWGAGVDLAGASGVHVGGTSAGYGNLISLGAVGQAPASDDYDTVDGVRIGTTDPAKLTYQGLANLDSVQGNYIGTDATGTSVLGNQVGVLVARSGYQATVGGNVAAARNVISGNRDRGVEDVSQTGIVSISANYIGIDVSGTSVLPNGTGVFAADDTVRIESNVISGNAHDGVDVDGVSGANSEPNITANIIGMDAAGQHLLGNGGDGLHIADEVRANAADDTVAGNGGNGVTVFKSTRVNILRGAVHDNGGLGIDLGSDGVSANDVSESDGVQNFPTLTGAEPSGDHTTIHGTLSSAPGKDYRIQVYATDSCDASGFGEGRSFVGSGGVHTDSGGNAGFSLDTGAPVPDGQVLTATATDGFGNTSEFSACLSVDTTPPTVAVDAADPAVLNASTASTALTWHADEAGTYLVEVGGDACGTGAPVATGGYPTAGASSTATVPTGQLSEGTDALRICVTDPAGNVGSAVTTVHKDTIAPTVTVDGIAPSVLNAASISTALTWRADEAGTYLIEAGGATCGAGTSAGSGSYATAGGSTQATVPANKLGEGPNTLRVCVTDAAGNVGSTTTTVVKDTVAPTVTPDPTADRCDRPGNPGWCLNEQTSGFTVTDATTGVATPCPATPGAPCAFTMTTTTNGSAVTVGAGTVCDTAGNCATDTASAGPYKIDSAAPTLAPILPSSILLHEDVTALPGATDPLVDAFHSGIADSRCGAVDTSAVGPHTITCEAADAAGNTARVTVPYVVEYKIDGFLAPTATSKWKRNQTVPVKIALTDANGVRIPDDEAQALVNGQCQVQFAAAGAQDKPASCFKYDATSRQFVCNWHLGSSATGAETITASVSYPDTKLTTTRSEEIRIS